MRASLCNTARPFPLLLHGIAVAMCHSSNLVRNGAPKLIVHSASGRGGLLKLSYTLSPSISLRLDYCFLARQPCDALKVIALRSDGSASWQIRYPVL